MSTGIFFRNSFEPLFFVKNPGKPVFTAFSPHFQISFSCFNSYELFSIGIFLVFRVIFPFLWGSPPIDK